MVDFSSVTSAHVKKAIVEFDALGRRDFLRRQRVRKRSVSWFIAPNRDLKPIAARAYQLAHPRSRIKTPAFNTNEAIAHIGAELGWELVWIDKSKDREDLSKGPELPVFDPSKLVDERRRVMRETTQRDGRRFKQMLVEVYGRCAVTGERAVGALEGAHIVPHSGKASDHVQNGLLLRADIHALYDRALIAFAPDYTIVVSHVLDGTAYAKLGGKKLKLPKLRKYWPSKMALLARQAADRKLHRSRRNKG